MGKAIFLKAFILSTIVLIVINSCKKDDDFHQITSIEKQIHQKVNDYRVGEGLNALVFQPILFREARAHSTKITNGTIEPGYEGLDVVFDDLRSKLGSGDAGAIVKLTDLTNSHDIVELTKENSLSDSIMLGTFTQSGVGYVTKENINYITILFLDIP